MSEQTIVEQPPVSDNNIESNDNTTAENTASEQQITTVFHDPINYNAKHPLQNTWTLWFDNPGKKANVQSWSQNLKEIVSIDTVEDFGVKVDRLEVSSNYHLFKKGVRPEWEDEANANGGKFSIQFPRNKTGENINNYWLHTVLAMIGEQFAYEDEICGAVVSIRKVFFRIALWIKSSERGEVVETIGRQLKEFLDVPNNIVVEFAPHGDTGGKNAQNRFVV
ncbi:unnamed protein product [Cunninghamella echinulata]